MSDLRAARTGRFAPSPTGVMHLGNARTALLAWLHTRALGGRHLLRFEDLDVGRTRPWAYDLTRRDLAWLGLTWDAEVVQSERRERYAAALGRLDTYRCQCTRRQIAEAVSAPHGTEAVYPGTCRPAGLPPSPGAAVRWRAPDGVVCAHDSRLGTLCQSLSSDIGDFVLLRADGAYAYHLAVVVDDAEQGVTDVVRGEDLWPSTPRHVALQQALGFTSPRYLHVPLMTDYRGQRLAKRGGAPSVAELREAGERPERVLASLARSLGWDVPAEVSAAELLTPYARNLDRLSKNEGILHPGER
ncbi:tRNA glutamyl-Q(34) synthetase GluQRS [Deinococcus peraridilitoris]|uniref:Glutamyl-Q tRNA(Asp) synthetase n=1 Tax=Deinococcus peraridilitoris (strain DSM 19664 / LMG 22246 / CIP 109416 / KR-200) TaxID=937777 RepID=L0A7Y0_DEIPD|nr:tRNA glutamyl-Q(34) synthetase GluQRS [Deinococcus peraridilitoris]AFZ69145.1 glutamyl-queuosine tRNA(Asp) synthetase [Deinococcus peraridilitoris DSM 19664]